MWIKIIPGRNHGKERGINMVEGKGESELERKREGRGRGGEVDLKQCRERESRKDKNSRVAGNQKRSMLMCNEARKQLEKRLSLVLYTGWP